MKKVNREPGNICPILREECKGWECAWYTQIRGTNPNTGEPVDHEGCTIAFIPMLLVENSQVNRETGAAVESTRNMMAEKMDVQNNLAATFTSLAVNSQRLRAIPHNQDD